MTTHKKRGLGIDQYPSRAFGRLAMNFTLNKKEYVAYITFIKHKSKEWVTTMEMGREVRDSWQKDMQRRATS
jgi:hypothetical protein